MQNINFNTEINQTTGNDTYVFPARVTSQRQILELYGVFSGASAALGYIDPGGTFIPLKQSIGGTPIVVTGPDGWVVEVPSSGKFALIITSVAAGTKIRLAVSTAAP